MRVFVSAPMRNYDRDQIKAFIRMGMDFAKSYTGEACQSVNVLRTPSEDMTEEQKSYWRCKSLLEDILKAIDADLVVVVRSNDYHDGQTMFEQVLKSYNRPFIKIDLGLYAAPTLESVVEETQQ